MSQRIKNQNIGSSFDAFLKDDGLLEVFEEQAKKAILQTAITQGLESGIAEGFDMEKIQQEMDSEAQD